MTQPIYVVKGMYSSVLEVYESKLIIKRQGIASFFIYGLKGDKTIFFKDITAIQFKKGDYIQFTLPGGNESTGGLWSALKDENTFAFSLKQNPLMREIQNFIESKRLKADQQHISSQLSIADEIRKFKELLDSGAISQDEFSKKKGELLGSSPKSCEPQIASDPEVKTADAKKDTPAEPKLNKVEFEPIEVSQNNPGMKNQNISVISCSAPH